MAALCSSSKLQVPTPPSLLPLDSLEEALSSLVGKMSVNVTTPFVHACTVAVVFNDRIKESNKSRLFWVATKSVLFNNTTSAHSTCSTSRSTTLRYPDSPVKSCPKSGRCPIKSLALYCSRKSLESTTVIKRFNCNRSNNASPSSAKSWKLSRICLGSATPLFSMTMWSKGTPRLSANWSRLFNPLNNSSLALQHAHPFSRETMSDMFAMVVAVSFLAVKSWLATNLASMLMDATSLTKQPILRSSLFSSMWRRRVVLPTPRKPDNMVTGVTPARMGMGVKSRACWLVNASVAILTCIVYFPTFPTDDWTIFFM